MSLEGMDSVYHGFFNTTETRQTIFWLKKKAKNTNHKNILQWEFSDRQTRSSQHHKMNTCRILKSSFQQNVEIWSNFWLEFVWRKKSMVGSCVLEVSGSKQNPIFSTLMEKKKKGGGELKQVFVQNNGFWKKRI